MKHLIRILVLGVALATGLTTASAQMVQLQVGQKVSNLPTTVTSYIDDPFRYFFAQFIVTGAGSDGVDVFCDMELTVNANAIDNANAIHARTQPGSIPDEPIHLSEGVTPVRMDMVESQFRRNRLEIINIDLNNPASLQQLPEGSYTLCVYVYFWSDRMNPNRVAINTDPCTTFEICYSGSAPELVTPMASAQTSLNGAAVLTPSRKVNFSWTPVIANCSDNKTRFKYQLKVVRVVNGQNYLDAIKYNPTIFSAEVRSGNRVVLDTLRDVKVQLEKGALYVAQVHAEQVKTADPFIVANEGNSQPMPFYWGSNGEIVDPLNHPRTYYSYAEEEEAEEGDESEGVFGLTLWEGGVEEVSELETILSEAFTVGQTPVLCPQHHYVPSDGYYTIPMSNDLEVGFTPAQHKRIKDVIYTIKLYNYRDEGLDSITANPPLISETIEKGRTLNGWGSTLKQGNLYYLQLSCDYTVDYWNYMIADTTFYVNGMVAEHLHDTVSRVFVEERQTQSNGVYFQWGDDPEAPGFTAPQWTAPVNRSNDDSYDPLNYSLPTAVPEVQKAKAFPVSWTPLKSVSQGDKAVYEVNVYELKPRQTPEEAISENAALVTRSVSEDHAIPESDTKFFKVFSATKTYVMTLSTSVEGDSDTFYHFKNGNEAIPAVFKVVK